MKAANEEDVRMLEDREEGGSESERGGRILEVWAKGEFLE